MRLYVQSDLHYDYYRRGMEPSYIDDFVKEKFPFDVDTVVIPGDIATKFNSARDILIALCDKFKYVVFCMGNHDLVCTLDSHKYKRSEDKIDAYHTLADSVSNLYMLDGNTVSIDGVKFGGSIGIWDMSWNCGYRKEYIDNYWLTKWYDGRYWNLMDNNIDAIRQYYLAQMNKVVLESPDVMVTHFSPLISIPDSYKPNVCSTYFYFDRKISDTITNKGCIWCSGHTHSALSVGNYKINPLGYPFETPLKDNKLERKDFVFAIDKNIV